MPPRQNKIVRFTEMLSQVIVTVLTVTCLTPRHASAAEARGTKPNIVIILANDLGETNNLVQAQSDRGNELLNQLKATRQGGGGASGDRK